MNLSPWLIREISFLRNLLAQFQREETQLFVLRVMVGLVILYDHVHPQGAFVKGSNVDVSSVRRPTRGHEAYPALACFLTWLSAIFAGERLCEAVEGPTALQERGPAQRPALHHEALERGEHAEKHKESASRMIAEAARLLH